MTNTFRVVIPTADGLEVAGEFPTLLNAKMFRKVADKVNHFGLLVVSMHLL